MARVEVNRCYRDAPEVVDEVIEDREFGPQRLNTRPVEENRFGPFSPKFAYAKWAKSLHPLQWFDTLPERTLANLLDSESGVDIWARIQRGEFTVQWRDGRYSPDLYALVDGVHYLLEVKRDRDMTAPDVLAKKAAAEDWARYVTDGGAHGTWRYLLVAEAVLKTAKTFAAVVVQGSAR